MRELYIKELTVTNYRKFKKKTFQLDKQMNVFAGKNSTGKTSVLEAANVVLGAYLAAYKTYVSSQYVFNISSDDAHLEKLQQKDQDVLQAGGIPQYPCTVQCRMHWGHSQEKEIKFQRTLLKEGARTKFGGSNPMQGDVVSWEKLMSKADHSDDDIILPIVLYLSSARLWNDNSAKLKEGVPTRTEGYSRCLNSKHGMEITFNYIEKMQVVSMEENNGRSFPAYETILAAVNTAFKEELSDGESIIFSARYKDIVALKKADGIIVPFQSLSDGYRNVIRIVLDIAARMCILNPNLKGRALEETPGVVLIDEIDLSLHPTWQRRIIQILKNLFPKVQFICATHSPFIIQSLEEGELQVLDGEIESSYSGEGIEDIAENIMDVDMPQYSEKRRKMFLIAEEYFRAVKEGKTREDLEKLRTKLVRIQAEYSDNPAFLALMKEKYDEQKLEVMMNETSE